MIAVGDYDGILKGKKLYAQPNTNVFKDKTGAIAFGNKFYADRGFGIYKLCGNCGESFYTKLNDKDYPSMHKVIKAVKIVGKITID